MKGINEFSTDGLLKDAWDCQKEIDGRWVAARPIGRWGFFYRLSKAWKVFIGKSDVLTWYKQ